MPSGEDAEFGFVHRLCLNAKVASQRVMRHQGLCPTAVGGSNVDDTTYVDLSAFQPLESSFQGKRINGRFRVFSLLLEIAEQLVYHDKKLSVLAPVGRAGKMFFDTWDMPQNYY
jgi:hypothetical protein